MARLKRGETRTKREQPDELLTLFEDTANITVACKKLRIPRRTHYNWMKEEGYAKRFDASAKLALGVLEDEANRRATIGVKKNVYYKGLKIDTITEYSDTLLIVLLKALAPEKYKDRVSAEHSGPGGKPIETNNTTVIKTTLKLS